MYAALALAVLVPLIAQIPEPDVAAPPSMVLPPEAVEADAPTATPEASDNVVTPTLPTAPAATAPAAPAATPAPPPSRIGVFSLTVTGLDEKLEQTLIDALATAVDSFEAYEVITKSDLTTMLGFDRQQALLGCEDDVACMAELGMAAGVDRIVGGSVSQIEGALVVSLQLINASYATIENRVTLKWPGAAAELSEVVGAAAELLVLMPKDRRPATVELGAVPEDAQVFVDGKDKGIGTATIKGLQPGVHTVSVGAPDHEPFHTDIVVRSGQSKPVTLALVAIEPVYTRWWFWTTIGVIAAAGAAAGLGIYFTMGGEEPKGTLLINGSVPGTQSTAAVLVW